MSAGQEGAREQGETPVSAPFAGAGRGEKKKGRFTEVKRPFAVRTGRSYLTETLIIEVVQQQPVAPPPFSEKSVRRTCRM